MINVGIIGVGEQCLTNLLPALLMQDNVTLKAICDIDSAKLDVLKNKFTNLKIYKDFNELINDPEIDTIIAACPPKIHFEVTILALKNNKNIFVEKPPAVNLAQMKEIHEKSLTSNSIYYVGLNFRHTEVISKIKSILNDDEVGNISCININHFCNKPKDPIWGLDSLMRSFLLAQAIHPIDLMLHLGGKIKSLKVNGVNKNSNIILSINLEFENGALGNLNLNNLYPAFETETNVFTNKSISIVSKNLNSLKIFNQNKTVNFYNENKRWFDNWQPSPLNSGFERTGYFGELKHFFDLIENNNSNRIIEDQIKVYEIFEQIIDEIK